MKTLLSAFQSVRSKPTPAFFPMFLSSSLLFPVADYKCRHTLQCLLVLNNSPILSGPTDSLACFSHPSPSLAMNLCLPRADDNCCGVTDASPFLPNIHRVLCFHFILILNYSPCQCQYMSHKLTALTLLPIFNRVGLVGLVQHVISSLAGRRERGSWEERKMKEEGSGKKMRRKGKEGRRKTGGREEKRITQKEERFERFTQTKLQYSKNSPLLVGPVVSRLQLDYSSREIHYFIKHHLTGKELIISKFFPNIKPKLLSLTVSSL